MNPPDPARPAAPCRRSAAPGNDARDLAAVSHAPRTWRRLAAPGLIAACLLAPGVRVAQAEPADYIFSPVVEEGEREIDSKAGLAHDRDGRSAWSASIGLEYGFTAWWASEATINFGREVGGSNEIDGYEWENRFQLIGDADDDHVLGFLFEVERARRSSEGYELRYGPLLQGTWHGVQANLNLLIERRLHADDEAGDGDDEASPLEGRHPVFAYQWQLRRPGESAWDVGLQGFGKLGRWDDWAPRSQQSHILGPTLFARLGDDDEDPQVEAGLLFGTGGAAPRRTLRLQAMIPF